MKPRTHILLRVAVILFNVAALGAVRFSAAADQYTPSQTGCGSTVPESSCAHIILKPSYLVKNLHPDVNKVAVWCATKVGEPDVWMNVETAIRSPSSGDASYSSVGQLPLFLRIPKSALTPGQVLTLTCELMLTRTTPAGVTSRKVAVASATAPQTPTDANWYVVSTGSAVKWTQTVTFPTAP